jgi:hypothetical protein
MKRRKMQVCGRSFFVGIIASAANLGNLLAGFYPIARLYKNAIIVGIIGDYSIGVISRSKTFERGVMVYPYVFTSAKIARRFPFVGAGYHDAVVNCQYINRLMGTIVEAVLVTVVDENIVGRMGRVFIAIQEIVAFI